MLFSFTACLATPEPVGSNEQETTTKKSKGERPISGIEGDYKFDEYSDHIVLTEYIGTSASLFIPDTINGKPVTEFGTIFKGNLTIKVVYIGKNCTEIVDNAFRDCFNLQRVEIEGGVKKIGNTAFLGCQLLSVIYIPACVKKIADDAFRYCTNVKIYGDKDSAAERLAEKYASIYFYELSEQETTAAVVSEDYTEDYTEAIL